MFQRVLSILAITVIAASAHPQALSKTDKEQLLVSARTQYYNLGFLGVKSFTCNVDVDWDGIFKQFNGTPLPADSPMMIYLAKSRLGVKETVATGAEITWANTGTPPDSVAASVNQLRGGVKQMLSGFFETWTANINGDLLSKDVTSVTATNGGYLVDEKSPGGDNDTLTFNKDMLLSHISNTSAGVVTEIDAQYLKTPQGLLVNDIEADSKQTVAEPPTHVTMTTDYQTVEGFQLPNTIMLSVRNIATFRLKLTDCTVEKLTK